MNHAPTILLSEYETYQGRPFRLYRYPNGYGASVTGDDRYGWTLAVVRFFDLSREWAYRWGGWSDLLMTDYSTPITSDVVDLSGLDDPKLITLLDQIAGLKGIGS